MMKKWFYFAAVLVVVLVISSCGNANSNSASNTSNASNESNTSNASNTSNESNTSNGSNASNESSGSDASSGSNASDASDASNAPSNANASNESNTSNTPNAASDAASTSPFYIGDWTVESVAGSTAVSTEPDKSMIGTKASYAADKATFGKDEIQNPEYKEQDMTKEEFMSEYRNQLSDIGIDADSVKTVTIGNSSSAGNFLIMKDDQTAIVLWDGNYYEMKRTKA